MHTIITLFKSLLHDPIFAATCDATLYIAIALGILRNTPPVCDLHVLNNCIPVLQAKFPCLVNYLAMFGQPATK